jgi:hypothetical protein
MGEAIGQMLPFAVGVAISPMSIVAMVLMLITPKAKANGFAFFAGWIVGIAVTGAVVLAIVGPSDPTDDGAPATWVNWLKLALGVVLFRLAVREWRSRPAPGAEVTMPKWMGALETFTPVKSAGLAVLLGALNPKNLVLIIGGATAVAQTDISAGNQAVVWLIFTVIATIGVAIPMGIYLFMGDKAAATLDGLKEWMAGHNAAIMAVLLVIIGVKLIGDAISGFAA